MNPHFRNLLGIAITTLVFATARGEVTQVEITSQQDVLGGKAFGSVGAYEKLIGKVHFAVDPNNPRDSAIADIDKAPRNAQGKVEFSSDLFIVRPKDPSRANGVLLFDVINRGKLQVFSVFNLAKGSLNPTNEEEFGDGLLMREGYTIIAVGWEFDIPRQKNLLLLDAPVATDSGKVLTGWVHPWFIPEKRSDSYEYSSGYFTPAYPPVNPEDVKYRLTERKGFAAAPRLIPRADWKFARSENGHVTADPNWVTLQGGFRPGMTYEVDYEAQNPPVAGLGFAAVRDLASALKYNSEAIVHGKFAYTYGSSQIGRWLRQMLYEGFTTDEKGRQAIDALFIQTGATSRGTFNERFGQPNELGSFTETTFPIRYETTTDPLTGKKDGLGAKIPKDLQPKVFFVDSGSEYWDRGRVAALRHTSIDGTEDLQDPPNVRVFSYAGARHGAGTWPPPAPSNQQLLSNPNDYRWGQRALLVSLDKWVRRGVEPPASRHPLLSDGTLIPQSTIKFPSIAGVEWPYHVPGGFREDLPGALSVLPFFVPQVDADGNDVAGIRMPEQALALGTYTDWAFRSEATGSPDTLVAMAGSFIPFPRTHLEQSKTQDPRKPIEERYSSRADYQKQVEAYANKMAQEHYLLQSDVPKIVKEAGDHWDWIMARKVSE